MKKNTKKLIKQIWNKYTKCSLYINAAEKAGNNIMDNELLNESVMYLEYVKGILNCLKTTDCKVLVAQYIDRTGNDNSYTKSGWYAKLRRANKALMKYFNFDLLKKKKKKDKKKKDDN